MEIDNITPDTTFPYRLFRFAHKRTLDAVSTNYFAIVSKDNHPIGLILLTDIDERWHHARSASTAFWQILVREFNHSESRSTLVRFEEALKELNKAVVKTQEKVKQPISIVAAILESNQIHFSTIGTSRVLLIRSGEFNDVTAGSDKSGNQFAAVTSGDLDANDTLVVANQSIYEFLAAEPAELWRSQEVDELSRDIQSRTQNSDQALNCLILRYNPDRPAQQTLYWEESEKRYPISLPKLSLPNLPKLLIPKINAEKFRRLVNFDKVHLPKISVPKLTVLTAILSGLRRLSSTVQPKYLLVGTFILIIAVIGILSRSRLLSPKADQSPEPSVTDQFIATIDNEAIKFLDSLVSGEQLNTLPAAEISKLVSAANAKNIELVTAESIQKELPEVIVGISQAGKSLFIVDQTGQLWEVSSQNQLVKIDHQFKVVSPQSIVAFSNQSLLITDKIGNIWQYRGQSDGPIALSLPPKLSSGEKLIARYGSNLYIYSQDQNSIYRQLNFSKKIETSVPYFGLSTIGNNPLWAWAVNGNFLVLTQERQLAGILRNELTLKPKTLPDIDENSRIASLNEELIILAVNHRLIGLGSKGQQLWEKFLLIKEPISDLAIANDYLWFSAGKIIYRLAL